MFEAEAWSESIFILAYFSESFRMGVFSNSPWRIFTMLSGRSLIMSRRGLPM